MKNLNRYLRASKKEMIQVQILETVYTVPADPPAIVTVNTALMATGLPEHEIIPLLQEAVDTVFGVGAFDEWIKWMSAVDINNILLWVQCGYDDTLLAKLDAQTNEEGQPDPPASPSATSENGTS